MPQLTQKIVTNTLNTQASFNNYESGMNHFIASNNCNKPAVCNIYYICISGLQMKGRRDFEFEIFVAIFVSIAIHS